MPLVPVNRHRPEQKAACDLVIYCGRGSALGNPFPITPTEDRATVIAKYGAWLWSKMKAKDPAVMNALNSIRTHHFQGKTVGLECFCHPLPCHTDRIIMAIEYLDRTEA